VDDASFPANFTHHRLIDHRLFAGVSFGLRYGMTWKKERDLLISQTMAFVQSVAGKAAGAGHRPETHLPSVSMAQPSALERPADVLPVARLSPISHGDFRDEIGRRVAAFRARQQAFHRDRDEYCNATMAKARAATEQAVKARDNRPLKR
jgi:hypothetical protein